MFEITASDPKRKGEPWQRAPQKKGKNRDRQNMHFFNKPTKEKLRP